MDDIFGDARNTAGVGVSVGINGGTQSGMTNSSPTGASRVGGALQGAVGALGALSMVFPPAAIALGAAKILGGAMRGSSVASSIAKVSGLSGGLNASYSHGRFKSDTESDGTSDTTSESRTKTTSDTTTTGMTETRGEGRMLQIENINKSIDEILKQCRKNRYIL